MYVVSIRYQNKTFNSQTINKDNPTIELIHLCQSQCPELEDIVLSLNEHDEIEIQTTGNIPLIIERYLRKRQCLANHPLVLFNHDTLWIGQNPVHRVDITNIRRVEKTSSRISRVSKNTMLASAAALAIMTIPACKQDPQNPGLVMPLCECPDVPCPPPGEPIPACSIGCCEEAQPAQIDADKNTANEQDPSVLPHPEVVGEPAVPEEEIQKPHPNPPGKRAPSHIHRNNSELDNIHQDSTDNQDSTAHPNPKVIGKMIIPEE